LGLIGNAVGMANQGSGLERSAPQMQTSATGEPIYSGAYYNQASNFKPQGATGGEVLGMAGQGAAAGTAIMPGIGTLIGGVVGAIGGLIGGGARRRKQKREKDRAMRSA